MCLISRSFFIASVVIFSNSACLEVGTGLDAGPVEPTKGEAPAIVAEGGPLHFLEADVLFSGAEKWSLPEVELASSWRFQIPMETAESSAFVLLHSDEESLFVVNRMESPSGEIWTSGEERFFTDEQKESAFGFPAQLFSPARTLASSYALAQLLPSWGAESIEVGTWTVDVKSYELDTGFLEKTEKEVSVRGEIWRRSSANLADSRVALHLYFVGELSGNPSANVAPLDVNNAYTHAQFSQSLRVLQDIFSAAGIILLEPELHEIVDLSLQVVDLDSRTCSGDDLDRLFLSPEANAPLLDEEGLHFFFVDRFFCLRNNVDVGAGIAGLAGGVPALMKLGAPKSGVAVATEAFLESPEVLGRIMAHEAGHAFGLFHTAENEALYGEPVFDILDDTPNGPGAEQNLMYFRITSDNTLSAHQKNVLQAHPVVGDGL
ncbi:MAG: hypothetical protein GY822_07785 [Deltaproteobacteria bacterium]|nr:hypothetical protein [Deltaproteobacteria bacterium]